MLHHDQSDVFTQNVASCIRHNPAAQICTYNAQDLKDHPDLQERHAPHPSRASDILLQAFWRDKEFSCDKWFVCEWDTYFTTSVENFFGPTYDLPFVVMDLMRLWTMPWWEWFKETEKFTVQQRRVMMGVVPFAFLIEESRLDKIVEKLPELVGANGECRFGTAAALAGFMPTVYCPARARYSWSPVNPARLKGPPSIFHSVKYLV